MPHHLRTLHNTTLATQIGAWLWLVTTVATWTSWTHPIQHAAAALLLVAGCASLLGWIKQRELVEALKLDRDNDGGTSCSDS